MKCAELLGQKEAAVGINSNSMIMVGGKVVRESLRNINIVIMYYTYKTG